MKHQRPSQFHDEAPFPAPLAVFGHSFATLQKEGLRFLNQRIEENVKAAEEFGSCRSLPDLFAAQQRWFAETTRAYLEEWQHCSELVSGMMRDAGTEPKRPDETH